MEKLFEIPLPIQFLVVGGYLAYKITVIGRGIVHRTEDFLLQVLAFGLVSQLGATLAISYFFPEENILYVGAANLTAAALLGIAWRWKGSRWTSNVMGKLRGYRDDHEASVWQSISNAPATWTLVYVHLKDGRLLEAQLDGETHRPMANVTLNEDGIALYLTSVHRVDGTATEYEESVNYGPQITYIPRSEIVQLDICWH